MRLTDIVSGLADRAYRSSSRVHVTVRLLVTVQKTCVNVNTDGSSNGRAGRGSVIVSSMGENEGNHEEKSPGARMQSV